jgi:L,D-transpeptidase YbiS
VPGSYSENLRQLALIDQFYADFKRHWTRYNGGIVPDRNQLEQVRRDSLALHELEPKGLFLLIDTSANRLYVRCGRELLFEAVCSTGSGYQLVQNGRTWTFQTPRGLFKIERKIENPVWRKPDWAFIESGQPLPEREDLRLEDSVLGEYALGFGGPYYIHGTLYTRLLGEPVTHGCIRLGAKDLEKLYRLADVGTPVLIY